LRIVPKAGVAARGSAMETRGGLPSQVMATLNKSLARRASRLRAVCVFANPRHSFGYGCGLRLASHPAAGCAPSRELIQRCLIASLVEPALFPADSPTGAALFVDLFRPQHPPLVPLRASLKAGGVTLKPKVARFIQFGLEHPWQD
jgi:hypothetical protein